QRYAEEGRVVSFGLETGRIRARAQGTRIDPYEVTIGLKPLPDMDWDLVVEIMSCQALYTAQLLSGEMPQDVEDVFDAAQASLFPRYKDDITAHCNCPDMANPCKHIAAVYFMMAEAFDKDPFLIFHLRGRSRDALLAMLRAQRAAEAQAMPIAVETMDAGSLEPLRFWQAGEELEAVSIQIHQPQIPGGNARRLGRPPFWRSPADPITRLAEVYETIGKRARDVAMGEPLVALEV
ncbi:MAG: SWIM zinc finger family protein, partial [Candidatus Sericytochromatia bacterium]